MAPRNRKRSILEKGFDCSQLDDVAQVSENDQANIDDEDDGDDKHAKFERQKEELNTSNSSLTRRALNSFSFNAAINLKSSRVDAVLAAGGCAGSLALLQFLTTATGYEMMGSFLVGSSVKFFFNENPPSLKAFANSSLFAVFAGVSLHFAPDLFEDYTRPVLVFATVLFWKLYGNMWGSANTLTLLVATESGGWTKLIRGMTEVNQWANNNDPNLKAHFPWHFLFFPYISGHLLLYGAALVMSLVRRKVRTYLIQREFVSKQVVGFRLVGGAERRQRLQKLFSRMDTSGDGQLDAIELQVALRAATGTDISLSDTRAILHSVDSDGSGSVDFDEFCASIDKLWPE